MKRSVLALALLVAGSAAASAQGYGSHSYYGGGIHAPRGHVVMPHRPRIYVPPHRGPVFGYNPHRRHWRPWHRRWW